VHRGAEIRGSEDAENAEAGDQEAENEGQVSYCSQHECHPFCFS